MLQIAADYNDGYLINADREQMTALRDAIDHALDHGEWQGVSLYSDGALPMRITVSDQSENT